MSEQHSSAVSIYHHKDDFELESGNKIKDLQIAYQTFGTLNQAKNNVVWVCHALTANADVMEWWPGLFGKNDLFNPNDHFIVCANVLGSHYGSTNPLSNNDATALPYYLAFPKFTIRDMVAAHQLLADSLGIFNIKVLVGGSLGGQQALEWSIMQPNRIENLILLATNAFHSPWGIAFNESQRLAIRADRTFYANQPDGGLTGLKAARSMALLSYRTYNAYCNTQLESDNDKLDEFRASSYQNYQGEKLIKRYNAYSYYYLTEAMDSHNVGRNRKGVAEALKSVTANTLVIAIENDLLFPQAEQHFLADHIPDASFEVIRSEYGHDGFLIETDALTKVIGNFLKESKNKKVIRLKHTG